MANEIQEKPTTVGGVVGKTIKGAFKGVGLVILGVVGLAAVSLLTFASPLLTAGAAIGAGIALFKGVSDMVKENSATDNVVTARSETDFTNTVKVAQQQAFEAGVNAGQVNVINKLQEIQAAAHAQQASFADRAKKDSSSYDAVAEMYKNNDHQSNFADKAKKGASSPESIIEQRKAAANAPQVG